MSAPFCGAEGGVVVTASCSLLASEEIELRTVSDNPPGERPMRLWMKLLL
jgi:hypothetical protein